MSNLRRRIEVAGILVFEMPSTLKTIIAATICFLCLCPALLSSSCTAPSITRGGFDSASPAARTHAIKQTVRKAEADGVLQREDLKEMVRLLIADDAMVRFMAIRGLIKLTDQDLGYRFFDPPEVRFQSVLKWRTYALETTGTDSVRVVPPPDGTTDTTSSEARG